MMWNVLRVCMREPVIGTTLKFLFIIHQIDEFEYFVIVYGFVLRLKNK